MLLHVLFEHAAGYALFAVKEVEEIGMLLPQVGLRWAIESSPPSKWLQQLRSLSGGAERPEHWEV